MLRCANRRSVGRTTVILRRSCRRTTVSAPKGASPAMPRLQRANKGPSLTSSGVTMIRSKQTGRRPEPTGSIVSVGARFSALTSRGKPLGPQKLSSQKQLLEAFASSASITLSAFRHGHIKSAVRSQGGRALFSRRCPAAARRSCQNTGDDCHRIAAGRRWWADPAGSHYQYRRHNPPGVAAGRW